jgi:hypothetical protein
LQEKAEKWGGGDVMTMQTEFVLMIAIWNYNHTVYIETAEQELYVEKLQVQINILYVETYVCIQLTRSPTPWCGALLNISQSLSSG